MTSKQLSTDEARKACRKRPRVQPSKAAFCREERECPDTKGQTAKQHQPIKKPSKISPTAGVKGMLRSVEDKSLHICVSFAHSGKDATLGFKVSMSNCLSQDQYASVSRPEHAVACASNAQAFLQFESLSSILSVVSKRDLL